MAGFTTQQAVTREGDRRATASACTAPVDSPTSSVARSWLAAKNSSVVLSRPSNVVRSSTEVESAWMSKRDASRGHLR